MPQRNIVSFTTLILAYSRLPHHAISAFRLLPVMINEGFMPNSLTFLSLIQASSSLEEHSLGSAMHFQVVRYGFFNGVYVQTSLLEMYSNCDDLEVANQVFSYIVDRDDIAWNSIIYGNFKNQKIMEGLQLFGSMVRDGSIPTHFTYSMVLNACSRIRDCGSGKAIHALVIKSDSPADMPLQNALLDMYSSPAILKQTRQFY